MLSRVLNVIHKITGHRDVITMYYNIKDHLYIQNIYNKISEIVSTCEICTCFKINNYRNSVDNHINAQRKSKRVPMDIFRPFRLDGYKNSCGGETGNILSIIGIYSRYTKLYFF